MKTFKNMLATTGVALILIAIICLASGLIADNTTMQQIGIPIFIVGMALLITITYKVDEE